MGKTTKKLTTKNIDVNFKKSSFDLIYFKFTSNFFVRNGQLFVVKPKTLQVNITLM